MTLSFDDSLPAFVRALTKAGINLRPKAGVFIRDTRGRLSFVMENELGNEAAEKVTAEIDNNLLPYISPLGPIADQSAPGAKRVLLDQEALLLRINVGPSDEGLTVRLIDRRAVGADWLHAPGAFVATPPRLVFASLKGGVGRSTALSVLAAHLAESGHALLGGDLDREAPGGGSMLIDTTATPLFGSIDFFVESALRDNLDDGFMRDCIAASWLGGGRGRIDVIPSIGSKSLDNPTGVLAKLARAYLESSDREGHQRTFLGQVQELVRRLTELSRYDAVLVDARAGLHETTAAAILGLGADILLFGVDQRQTIVGFNILLSHLKQFPVASAEEDWRYRLRMVQAKASNDAALATYRAHMFDLFDSIFYEHEDTSNSDILEGGFRFSVDDIDAPHFPIPIFDDDRYRLFDPVQDRTQLGQEMYKTSFGHFIAFCTERLQLAEDDTP